MPPNRDASRGGPGRPSKVRQLIEEYDLDALAEELERRWTAPREDRDSLRDLAAYVNQQALGAGMARAGLSPLDGEVENTYRLLTDDEVDQASRTQAERRLEREGIDVDALRDRFVSYQAVRTYLTNYRGVEHAPNDDTDDSGPDTETLQRMVGRTETIARAKLERLEQDGQVSLGDYTVSAPVRVFCTDCGSRFEIAKLLARGSCDCEADFLTDI